MRIMMVTMLHMTIRMSIVIQVIMKWTIKMTFPRHHHVLDLNGGNVFFSIIILNIAYAE